MTGLETAMVLGWVALIVVGLVFQFLFGWPWNSRGDREMSWHLFLTNLIIWLEPLGFLLIGVSLWPSVVVLYLAILIRGWQIGLLVRTRQRANVTRTEDPEGDTDAT